MNKFLTKNKAVNEEVLICAEYTGQYTYPLNTICNGLSIDLWLENPAQIKYSSGVHRGKNDKLNARKIAEYAEREREKAQLFAMPDKATPGFFLNFTFLFFFRRWELFASLRAYFTHEYDACRFQRVLRFN